MLSRRQMDLPMLSSLPNISTSRTVFCRLAVLAGVVASLTGCFQVNTTQAPIATTYPYSEQQRMQAAEHWRVLADHEASQILADRTASGLDLYVSGDDHAPGNENEGGEFGRGFRDLLTSELVSGGADVMTSPSAQTATIEVEVELVNHRDRGYVRPPRGTLTALSAGVAVATHPFNHWAEPALATIPAAMGADLFSGSWTRQGNEEIIVTTRIVDNERILYSSSNLYYTNQGDRRHYAPNRAPQAPTVPVTGSW